MNTHCVFQDELMDIMLKVGAQQASAKPPTSTNSSALADIESDNASDLGNHDLDETPSTPVQCENDDDKLLSNAKKRPSVDGSSDEDEKPLVVS